MLERTRGDHKESEEEWKKVALVQIGYGTVGGAVIRQVVAQRAAWREMLGLDVRIAAVAGKNGVVLQEGDSELSDEQLIESTKTRGAEATGSALTEIVPAIQNADVVILMDAAAGEATTDALVNALNAGGGVVLSNKAPMALPPDSRTSVLWEHARLVDGSAMKRPVVRPASNLHIAILAGTVR